MISLQRTLGKAALPLFLLCAPLYVAAQSSAGSTSSEPRTPAPFQVKVDIIVQSDCPANGQVSIKAENASDYYDFRYAFYGPDDKLVYESPIVGSESTSALSPNVSPGTYKVVVLSKKKGEPDTTYENTLTGIVVPGTYSPLIIGQNQTESQEMYAGCGAGQIVVNVRGGRPPYKARFSMGPANLMNHVFTHGDTYNGVTCSIDETNGRITFTGIPMQANYNVQVSDACDYGNTTGVFRMNTLSAFPRFNEEGNMVYSGFPDLDALNAQVSCTHPMFRLQLNDATKANPSLMHLIRDGKFEVAVAPAGQQPTTWTDMGTNLSENFVVMPLGNNLRVTDYYGQDLTFYVRHKECTNAVQSFPTRIPKPSFTNPFDQNASRVFYGECGKAMLQFTTSVGSDRNTRRFFCYPLTVTVRENNSTGTIVGTKTLNKFNETVEIRDLLVNQSRTYYYEVVDANNFSLQSGSAMLNWRGVNAEPSYNCDGRTYRYSYLNNTLAGCNYTSQWHEMNNGVRGAKVGDLIDHSVRSEQWSPILDMTKSYRLEFYRNGNTNEMSFRDYDPQTYPAPVVTLARRNPCGESQGINISYPGTMSDVKIELYENDNVIFTWNKAAGKRGGFYITRNLIPGATHKFVSTEGDCVKEFPLDLDNRYTIRDFQMTTSGDCNTQMQIVPQGTLYFGKNVDTQGAWFKIISGPAGGATATAVRAGQPIELSEQGKYVLGAFADPSTCDNSLVATLPLEFSKEDISVDINNTTAYSCKGDATGYDGNIFITLNGGLKPYKKVELWDEAGTTQLTPQRDGKPLAFTLRSDGSYHMPFGVLHTTYTVKFEDACGRTGAHKVTVVNVSQLVAGRNDQGSICEGSTIHLIGHPFGTYKWYRPGVDYTKEPNNIFSTLQNPVIENASLRDGGRYTVVFQPEFCDDFVPAYPTITVNNCFAPVNPHLMNKVNATN